MEENVHSGIYTPFFRKLFYVGGNNERFVFKIDRFFLLAGAVG